MNRYRVDAGVLLTLLLVLASPAASRQSHCADCHLPNRRPRPAGTWRRIEGLLGQLANPK